MKRISPQLFPVKSSIRSERAYILSEIILELETSGRKVIPRVLAVKTSHIPTDHLRDFLADCRRYCKEHPNYPFGKIFWGKLK